MSVLEGAHLKDILRVRDNGSDGRDALAGLTLAAILGGESQATNPRRGPSRTLLDIIKQEETGAAYKCLAPPGQGPKDKHSWKSFKNRIRRRTFTPHGHGHGHGHGGNAYDFSVDDVSLRISNPTLLWRRNPALMGRVFANSGTDATTSGSSAGNSSSPAVAGAEELRPAIEEMSLDSMDGIEQPRAGRAMGLTRIPSLSQQRAEIEMELEQPREGREMGLSRIVSLAAERARTETRLDSADNAASQEITSVTANAAVAEADPGPPRVSLMALLGETDWNSEAAESLEVDEVGEELGEGAQAEDDDDEEEGGEGGEAVCCVCMVRHKGAAFIPCGHTFCRLCSRELWVNRGNCPLCNNYILEILDIF